MAIWSEYPSSSVRSDCRAAMFVEPSERAKAPRDDMHETIYTSHSCRGFPGLSVSKLRRFCFLNLPLHLPLQLN